MALTTDVSGTTSDSYCSLAEANDLVSWRGSSAWTAASDATKEAVLKAAVSMLDRLNYKAPKAAMAQALRLPHSTMTDTDGAYYIPERVKRAQAYLALYMLEDPEMFSGLDNVRQVSVPGGFSVTMADTGGSGGVYLPSDVLLQIQQDLWKWGPTTRDWDSASRRWV